MQVLTIILGFCALVIIGGATYKWYKKYKGGQDQLGRK